jgi:hypothetical protein
MDFIPGIRAVVEKHYDVNCLRLFDMAVAVETKAMYYKAYNFQYLDSLESLLKVNIDVVRKKLSCYSKLGANRTWF